MSLPVPVIQIHAMCALGYCTSWHPMRQSSHKGALRQSQRVPSPLPSGLQDWLGREHWGTVFPFQVTILWISSTKFPGNHFAYCPHRVGRSLATMPLWLSLCSPGVVLYKPLHFSCCLPQPFPVARTLHMWSMALSTTWLHFPGQSVLTYHQPFLLDMINFRLDQTTDVRFGYNYVI